MRLLERLREMVRDEQREIRIAALQLRIAVRMAVDRHDAVRILHDHMAVRIHAERPHEIAVPLRAVDELRLVDLRGDIVPDLVRHLDAHTDIDAVVLLPESEPVALVAEPLRARASRRDDEILRRNAFAAFELDGVFPLAVGTQMRHGTLEAERHLFLQIFIRRLEHLEVVLRAEMTHARLEQMQIVLERPLAER